MRKMMKRLAVLVPLLCLMVCAAAQAEWSELFGDAYAQQFQLSSLKDQIVTCYAMDGHTVYGMTAKGAVYTYDCETAAYALFTQLPAQPDIDFEKKPSEATKQAMGEAVSYLLFDENHELYGFNSTTGLLGKVDANGIQWQDTAVDTSVFYNPGGYYPEISFCQPQIIGDRLEGWIVPDIDGTSCTWVSLSLTDGSCTATEIPGAFQLCRYRDDTLLALVLTKDKTMALNVYDRSGACVRSYEGALPALQAGDAATVFDLQSIAGALAYDAASGTVYLMDESHLYVSRDGGAFEALEGTTPWLPPMNYSRLQLGDNDTVLVNGQWLWQ
ncbi:MAG: hypothetical protein Q4B32_09905 [Clostridia bacterium]|nr:hypothetical protein [Clostridia bacterium]